MSFSYKLVKMMFVWMCVCLDVNQGGINGKLRTETCNLACTDLLMNPDRVPKTRPV